MAPASVWTDVNKGKTRNRGIAASKLKACTQKFPKRSVSHPPSHEPVIAPNPKQASTIPTSRMEKSNACVMYSPRKGRTMTPVRLKSITRANHHAGRDNLQKSAELRGGTEWDSNRRDGWAEIDN